MSCARQKNQRGGHRVYIDIKASITAAWEANSMSLDISVQVEHFHKYRYGIEALCVAAFECRCRLCVEVENTQGER
jgi:hypothetical protein